MSEAQSSTRSAVALLRLVFGRAPDPGFDGELIQLGRVVPWR
jgi:hypothetical protein